MSYPDAVWERAMTVQQVILKALAARCIGTERRTFSGSRRAHSGAGGSGMRSTRAYWPASGSCRCRGRQERVHRTLENATSAFFTATTGVYLTTGQITCQTKADRSHVNNTIGPADRPGRGEQRHPRRGVFCSSQ